MGFDNLISFGDIFSGYSLFNVEEIWVSCRLWSF